MELDSGLDS